MRRFDRSIYPFYLTEEEEEEEEEDDDDDDDDDDNFWCADVVMCV